MSVRSLMRSCRISGGSRGIVSLVPVFSDIDVYIPIPLQWCEPERCCRETPAPGKRGARKAITSTEIGSRACAFVRRFSFEFKFVPLARSPLVPIISFPSLHRSSVFLPARVFQLWVSSAWIEFMCLLYERFLPRLLRLSSHARTSLYSFPLLLYFLFIL